MAVTKYRGECIYYEVRYENRYLRGEEAPSLVITRVPSLRTEFDRFRESVKGSAGEQIIQR